MPLKKKHAPSTSPRVGIVDGALLLLLVTLFALVLAVVHEPRLGLARDAPELHGRRDDGQGVVVDRLLGQLVDREPAAGLAHLALVLELDEVDHREERTPRLVRVGEVLDESQLAEAALDAELTLGESLTHHLLDVHVLVACGLALTDAPGRTRAVPLLRVGGVGRRPLTQVDLELTAPLAQPDRLHGDGPREPRERVEQRRPVAARREALEHLGHRRLLVVGALTLRVGEHRPNQIQSLPNVHDRLKIVRLVG